MNSVEIATEKVNIRNRLISRRKNYAWIFRGISFYKKVDKRRGELLESYYYLMRFIDDIVDGDARLPSDYLSGEEFLERKLGFLRASNNPKDFADYMIIKSFDSAYSLGLDLMSETKNIFGSMLFDAKRKGKYMILDKQILDKHYDMLDIEGCISGSLKVMGEDHHLTDKILPLGQACRIYYDTRDLNEDIQHGFVNIPREELDFIGVSVDDIINGNTSNLVRYRASLGLNKLLSYAMPKELKPLTKMTLILGYEMPSRAYFNKVFKQYLYKQDSTSVPQVIL